MNGIINGTCKTLAFGWRGLIISCFPEVKRTLSESGAQETEYTGDPGGMENREKYGKKLENIPGARLKKSCRNSYSKASPHLSF